VNIYTFVIIKINIRGIVMNCNSCGAQVGLLNNKNGKCKKCHDEGVVGVADTHSKEYHSSLTNGTPSNAIQTLKGFAQLVLVVGIFISIAILIGSLANEMYFLIVYAIAIFIATLIQWAFIKVFAEMAEDIKEIRNFRASGE
jgi:hypothetical protein